MREEVEGFLRPVEASIPMNNTKPFVVLALGVNGVGKTTTIAKIAHIHKSSGKRIVLGACDTFRAAAVEQLEVWAGRIGIEVIKHGEGSDPAAVAFDATKAAKARGADVLILDTAGRLHTKVNLMEEMKKIKRVVGKELHGAPNEVLLIIDATNGQNAIAQARTFNEALTVTGLVITKLDGTAKGGFVLPIAHLLKIPIRYIGVGEGIDDLIPFSAKDFAEALIPQDLQGASLG
jgi:fused signal recognition particle receptor